MKDRHTLPAGRPEARETWPFFAFVTLMVTVGYVMALRADPKLLQPLRFTLLTLLMVSSLLLYWASPLLLTNARRVLAFCFVQGSAAFAIALLAPHDWLVLSLYGCLIGIGAAALWPDWRLATGMGALCLGFMSATLVVTRGLAAFLGMLPFIAFMSLFVCTYVILFIRQFLARQQAQELLQSLQDAHNQLQEYAGRVEELTRDQERQRMGRELHDTLAQGLAGITMQLEAIEGHLDEGNTARAGELIRQAKQRTRTTLSEARRAILALRPEILERTDLREALHQEADQFEDAHGIPCEYEASVDAADPPPEAAQHMLRFVQEGLTNVARHARATRARVRYEQAGARLRVSVEDDGVGFDPAIQRPGLGLTGMRERARRLRGEVVIDSSVGDGTTVSLVVQTSRA